jgi:hypothetical protein
VRIDGHHSERNTGTHVEDFRFRIATIHV